MACSIHEPATAGFQESTAERRALFLLIGASFLLRIVFAFRYSFDSDEPQHLHVIWGWTNGLLQYRDIFDNHTPLFHLLFAPLLSVWGESADVLYVMRLAMIPLFALALWITHAIGKELFSQRAGVWAAVFAGLFPAFFLCSVEFRTDNLWTVFWLLAVLCTIRGGLAPVRALLAGLLLGAAAGVSLKTTLLFHSFVAAGALSLAIYSLEGYSLRGSFVRLTARGVAFLSGLLVVPVAVALFFYSQGAIGPFLYGTVLHNMLDRDNPWWHTPLWAGIYLIAVAALCLVGRVVMRRTGGDGRVGIRRVFVVLIVGIYTATLLCFWPLVTLQNFLPVLPLFFVVITPLILRGSSGWRWSLKVPVAVALFEIALLLVVGTPWVNETARQTELIGEVLRLTDPDDPVMDLKGEMVYRKRAFYFVLETITLEKIERGTIADDIPEVLAATSTCVAMLDDAVLPRRARDFLNRNYIPVGQLRVAGLRLDSHSIENPGCLDFDVSIPARYTIVSKRGTVAEGVLDGSPLSGPRFLETGRHRFCPSDAGAGLSLIWTQALDRGFLPRFNGSDGR